MRYPWYLGSNLSIFLYSTYQNPDSSPDVGQMFSENIILQMTCRDKERAYVHLWMCAIKYICIDFPKSLPFPIVRQTQTRKSSAMNPEPPQQPQPPRYTLRTYRPGDIGWIIHRHAILYKTEYGWGTKMEALVCKVGAEFLDNYDASTDR